MEEILYQRQYDNVCEDVRDIDFLKNYSETASPFYAYDDDMRLQFYRLSIMSTFIAEELRGKFTMTEHDGGITISIEAAAIKVSTKILQMIGNLLLASDVSIASKENMLLITANYTYK